MAKASTKTTASEVISASAEDSAIESNETQASNSTQIAAFVPKLKRIVTLPLFKWAAGKICYYKFTGEMFVGKTIKEGAGAPKKEPAILCNVIDLDTGEAGQIIMATVLRSILDEEYPNKTYVGLSFAIKQRKIPGKDYNGFDVAEIE